MIDVASFRRLHPRENIFPYDAAASKLTVATTLTARSSSAGSKPLKPSCPTTSSFSCRLTFMRFR